MFFPPAIETNFKLDLELQGINLDITIHFGSRVFFELILPPITQHSCRTRSGPLTPCVGFAGAWSNSSLIQCPPGHLRRLRKGTYSSSTSILMAPNTDQYGIADTVFSLTQSSTTTSPKSVTPCVVPHARPKCPKCVVEACFSTADFSPPTPQQATPSHKPASPDPDI